MTTASTERMLINATHPEELRVALVRGNYLYDLDIEKAGQTKKKANIYKARITRIEPSLEAAFVEYGSQRQGFLPLKEIASEYFSASYKDSGDSRPNIRELLKEGQELMVQIDKEERGTKGAALTTYITLAGCYLVLMPNNPRAGGISRRIEGDDRDELREAIRNLKVPDGMGVIVRTAGMGKSPEDLQWDLDVLINQWHAIREVYTHRPAPFLIQQEGDVIIRSLRDNLRKDIDEIIIDNAEAFIKAKNYIEQIKPEFLNNLKLYQDSIPLFSRHQIESQIETAYQREVLLPSGGHIVIDRTEALVSIDVNSAKSTGGSDIEQTALNTNLEATEEVARQLRLRDLGGLIVIDFIDMIPTRNQREVETRLRHALRTDRARVQIGRISRFGLLEMSRQRLRPALAEVSQEICPRCDGRGIIRSVESIALSVIRLLEEEALKANTREVQIQLPVDVATFVINEKRDAISAIEEHHKVNVLVIPNQHLTSPKYKISRQTNEEGGSTKRTSSYRLVETPEPTVVRSSADLAVKAPEPALKEAMHQTTPRRGQEGLLKRLWNSLFGSVPSSTSTSSSTRSPQTSERSSQHTSSSHHRPRHQQHRGSQGGSGGRSGGQHRQHSPNYRGNQQRRGPQQPRQQGQQQGSTSSGGSSSSTSAAPAAPAQKPEKKAETQ